MLGRPDEPLKNLWKNRILKIAVILLVFSLLYYCNDIRTSSKEFVWGDFFGKLYASNLKYHLWYLYAYIAYLVSIPFLKSLVKSLQEKYYYYLIFLALFLNGVLPSLEYYFFQGSRTINGNLKLTWLTANIVLYPCLGYFLQHKLDIQQVVSKIPLIWILNVAGIAISCYMTYYKGMITGGFVRGESQTFHNAFVLLNCIAIFITLKWVFETMSFSPKIHGCIKSLGKCTFGIYLLHLWIKEWGVLKRMLTAMRAAGINDMVSVFVYCFIVMLIAYIITLVISKIPVLKRMVGF